MKKKLKIATLVSSLLPSPPPLDFPWIFAPARVAVDVGEELTKRGHEIIFFGSQESKSKIFKTSIAPFVPLYKNKIYTSSEVTIKDKERMVGLFDAYLMILILKGNLKKKFDIIHVHPIDRVLPLGFFTKTPIVYTIHDPICPWRAKAYKLYQAQIKNQYLVSISDAQRKPAPHLNWIGTVYNGLDLKFFPFSNKPKNQCLFLGRIKEEKGTAEAIQAAIKAKERLIIVGDRPNEEYWRNKVKPYLRRKNIRYAGYVPYKKTYTYYGEAKALLCPIKWEEPFGLTFIEAMACGTPVIAFDKGSAKEVIIDGKTGFIVKNVSEMVKAIKKVDQIKRSDCRKWVEKRFTKQEMAEEYEKVYYEILKSKS